MLNLPDPFKVEEANTPFILEPAHAFGKPNELVFRWTATNDPFLDRYVVLIKKYGEPFTSFQEAGRTQDTKYFFDNLEIGQTYVARVYVLNSLGRKSHGKSSGATKFSPTYTAAGGSATAVTTNKVNTTIGTTELGA